MVRKANKKHAATAASVAAVEAVGATVKLNAHCSVKEAVALKDSLCAVVQQPNEVVIEANSVERVDAATMQLLCAFVRERAAHSRKVAWQGCPPALTEAARLLGVGSLLELPR